MTFSTYVQGALREKAIFFTGKGGVGKTTLVWTLAAACAKAGARVAVAGWDPYHPASESRSPMPEVPCDWIALETLAAFREYSLKVVRFEKVYDTVFDGAILRTFLLAMPGLSDTVIAGKVMSLTSEYDLTLIDLPSSGHSLRFFQSPAGVHRLFPFGFVHRETRAILDFFQSATTRIDVVTIAEAMPLQETAELLRGMEERKLRIGALHINQLLPEFPGAVSAGSPNIDRYQHYQERVEAERASLKAFHELSEKPHPEITWPHAPTATRWETVRALLALEGR